MVRSCAALLSLPVVMGQQAGQQAVEEHLDMPVRECSTSSGDCALLKSQVTLDANWRWVHGVGGYTNCYDGTSWSKHFCPDAVTCSKNCALEGVDAKSLKANYGVSAIERAAPGIELKYEAGNNVGSRMYLMDTEKTYQQFFLKNKEFAFDADMSSLPCGVNAAVYFVEMEADGGVASTQGKNAAGAKFGTGYCDAQCPHDIKFVNGKANLDDQGNSTRLCCAEMDIWEANEVAAAFTPHPCKVTGSELCKDDDECGAMCDPDGCDFNAYREGMTNFYGSGENFDLNTAKPFTIVTQFLTDDNTDTGDLSEIRRFYIQDGKKIENPKASIGRLTHNSLTDDLCATQKDVFGEPNKFADKGGMKQMGEAMARGMTFVMSIWDDSAARMLWLDSHFPVDSTQLGSDRGPCSMDSGDPEEVRRDSPNAAVQYSNIRFGDIGSTQFPDAPPPPTTTTTQAPLGEYAKYESANCYAGHGGQEIDSGGAQVASAEECERRCDEDESCECVTFRKSGSEWCWKRAACQPAQFLSDGGYDTYVKAQAETVV